MKKLYILLGTLNLKSEKKTRYIIIPSIDEISSVEGNYFGLRKSSYTRFRILIACKITFTISSEHERSKSAL